jgi:hypothetical protein
MLCKLHPTLGNLDDLKLGRSNVWWALKRMPCLVGPVCSASGGRLVRPAPGQPKSQFFPCSHGSFECVIGDMPCRATHPAERMDSRERKWPTRRVYTTASNSAEDVSLFSIMYSVELTLTSLWRPLLSFHLSRVHRQMERAWMGTRPHSTKTVRLHGV